MHTHRNRHRLPAAGTAVRPALAAVLAALATAAAAQAPGHAHAHGRMQLDLAIDGPELTVQIDSPLDNLLGFERAPRTEAERRQARQARERLSDPAALFVLDPAAGCRPAGSALAAPALGWLAGPGAADGPPQVHDHDHAAARDGDGGEHADLQARYAFRCADAARARFVELPLFDAFPRLRVVSARIAAPQGQFLREVARPARRLAWGR
ncbi:MAG: DUF2796 domain-containing protein [Xylophilus ampelinus]